jgi:hypothetical protein
MEYAVIALVLALYILYKWYGHAQQRNRYAEAALKDFVEKIVLCKVEHEDGMFYLYNGLNNEFVTQGKTSKDIENFINNNENKFFMNFGCDEEIVEQIKRMEAQFAAS